MHKSNEDCFYFLTSSCAKGSSCTYRHSPLALTCNVICPAWVRGNCPDPACVFRHSTIQRPMVNNGIMCFYENTPTGCLKPECTFIHSRPRMNLKNTPAIRPVLNNPIKSDTSKPIANSTPSATIPQPTQTSESNLNAVQSIKDETSSITPTSTSLTPDTASPVAKTETVTRRIAIPPNTELSNEIKDSPANTNNNPSSTKSITRSVITDSPKINSEETTTTPQTRLVVNRSVVIGESTNHLPTRTIVQTAPSSSRIVVSSNSVDSSSKGKKNEVDSAEEKIETKKFKSDSQSTTNNPSTSSTSSIGNRLLITTSKETTSTNDTKSTRLNRHRLPATQTSSGNSSPSVSTPSNEEKTSAGTGLLPSSDRRTMRLERFQKKPTSPIRPVTGSSSITTSNTVTTNASTTRNVITSSPNERKRTVPEITMKNEPPSKRASISPRQTTSSPNERKRTVPEITMKNEPPSKRASISPRQTTSSPNVLTNSSSSIRNKNWEKQTDGFIAKNAQQNTNSPTKAISSPERPRFTPQLITGPSSQQSSTIKPPSVVIKRSLTPVTAPSPTSTKPTVQVPPNTSKSTIEHQSSNTPNEEDENQLLKLNDSADIVDTFALIDEALLEADHLLELM